MRLNPPKKNVWKLSLILALVGVVVYVLRYFITMPSIAGVLSFVVVVLAWFILWLGNFVKGL